MKTPSTFWRYFFLLVMTALVSQWMVFHLYLTSLGKKQQLLQTITNSPLIDLVKSKTGLQLESFHLVVSDQPYAAMIGIPGHPYMLISSKLNETFTDTEKEYVVLHETGHYLLHHSQKELFVFILLFIAGCFIIQRSPFYLIPVAAILLGLIYIQYGMQSELTADHFAVTHMSDPNGMITSTEKFRNAHYPPIDDYSWWWPILYRSTPYHLRIEMAQNEIKSRLK